MRYIGILDTETSSLEPPPVGRTIEVAVMLYDIKHAQPVSSFASLIQPDDWNEECGASVNPAEHVNGIPGVMLDGAQTNDLVWRAVRWLLTKAELIVAHRAEFDIKFVPDLNLPWVCSKVDIKWPGQMRGDSLVQLALNLGLGVASAHRATADVDTLARILTRVAERGADLEALFQHALRPKVKYYAQVSYEQRELAKQNGFLWDPADKKWWRFMPPSDIGELPFPVKTS